MNTPVDRGVYMGVCWLRDIGQRRFEHYVDCTGEGRIYIYRRLSK